MRTQVLRAAGSGTIAAALTVLRRGGLVAFPTDTVYGLGALADAEEAVRSIYKVKGRGAENALPILLHSAKELGQLAADVPPQALWLAERFWPGPLTLILRKSPWVSGAVSSLPTVGIRVPAHPFALALLREAGPMAVTSANLSGGRSPSTSDEVMSALGGRVDLLIDGGVAPGGRASTIVDLSGEAPQVLREGPISVEEILAALSHGA